jgi:hypothetical protein
LIERAPCFVARLRDAQPAGLLLHKVDGARPTQEDAMYISGGVLLIIVIILLIILLT